MDYSKIIEQLEKDWNPPYPNGIRGWTTSQSNNYSEKINGYNYNIELIKDGYNIRVKNITCTDIKFIRKEKLEKINNENG